MVVEIAPRKKSLFTLLALGLLAGHASLGCENQHTSQVSIDEEVGIVLRDAGTTDTGGDVEDVTVADVMVDPEDGDCLQYCKQVEENCSGDNQLFNGSRLECLDACQRFPATGAVDDESGDTLQCRFTHAKRAATAALTEMACQAASTGGGGTCGEVDACDDLAEPCAQSQICNNGVCEAFVCTADALEAGDGNSTQATAGPLSLGETVSDLTICSTPTPDEDWFSFNVPDAESSLYAVVKFTSRTGDLEARLEFPAEAARNPENANSGTDNETIAFPAGSIPAGDYLFAVFGNTSVANGANNRYSINIQLNPPGPDVCRDDSDCSNGQFCDSNCDTNPNCAFVCLSQPCVSGTDCGTSAELECNTSTGYCESCTVDSFDMAMNNNSGDTATNLNGNLVPEETLNTCNGDDFYTFDAVLNQNITIRIEYDSTKGDIDMVLLPPSGAGDRTRGTTLSSGTQSIDQIEFPVNATAREGNYILQVLGVGQQVNDYKISVTITGP